MGDQGRDDLLVYGYHGTNQENAAKILADGFSSSRNLYDWLGDGVYFFQDAPQRAQEWAIDNYPATPAVIGAEILLSDCIDLLDTVWPSVMSEMYDSYLNHLKRSGNDRPNQIGGAHRPTGRASNQGSAPLLRYG